MHSPEYRINRFYITLYLYLCQHTLCYMDKSCLNLKLINIYALWDHNQYNQSLMLHCSSCRCSCTLRSIWLNYPEFPWYYCCNHLYLHMIKHCCISRTKGSYYHHYHHRRRNGWQQRSRLLLHCSTQSSMYNSRLGYWM